VPSRMNVVQVLETHLGWAAHGIGRRINTMLEQQQKTAEIRKFLDEVYNQVGGSPADLKSLNDSQVLDLAKNLTSGLPFATRAFDGPAESEIKKMLELAELPGSGQTTLYDGRTGDAFDRPVTLGYMYAQAQPPGR